jgi:hypothetical protein
MTGPRFPPRQVHELHDYRQRERALAEEEAALLRAQAALEREEARKVEAVKQQVRDSNPLSPSSHPPRNPVHTLSSHTHHQCGSGQAAHARSAPLPTPAPFIVFRRRLISPIQPVKENWKAVTFLNCYCILPESPGRRSIEEVGFSFRLERPYSPSPTQTHRQGRSGSATGAKELAHTLASPHSHTPLRSSR